MPQEEAAVQHEKQATKWNYKNEKFSSGRTSAYNVGPAEEDLNGWLCDTHLFLTGPDLCN